MKHFIGIIFAISLCSFSSVSHATVLVNNTLVDTGFTTMYHDWLSAFTRSSSLLISPMGGAEEGSVSFNLSGSYHEYRQCEYTGASYDDYVCNESVTPLATTSLATKLTMPYRVAIRPSKKKNSIDMSMSVDLRMDLAFTDGTTTVVVPDAHIAGTMIMKNNNRNLHFYLSAFDVSLTGTLMGATDQAEMQAAITLIKSRLLHTRYYTRVDTYTYTSLMQLMQLSKQVAPIDMAMLMQAGILNNLGRDPQSGGYRITINMDRVPGFFDTLLMYDNMSDTTRNATNSVEDETTVLSEKEMLEIHQALDDAMLIATGDSIDNDAMLVVSGTLGRITPDNHVALTLDTLSFPLDEDGVSMEIADCAFAAELTKCHLSAKDGSGNALAIQLSGSTLASGGSFMMSGSVLSHELIGVVSIASQRASSEIRASDFALPRRSRSWDKAMQSFEEILNGL